MVFYQGTNGRTAVLLPGRGYSPNHPVLYYAREVLLVQGWSVIWLTPLLSELVETITLFVKNL